MVSPSRLVLRVLRCWVFADFQANQLTQIIIDIGITSAEIKAASFSFIGAEINTAKFVIGTILMIFSGIVIIGGIQRIGRWAGKMVPLMIVVYFVSVVLILIIHIDKVPHYFVMIITDAFAATHFRGEPSRGCGRRIDRGGRSESFIFQ